MECSRFLLKNRWNTGRKLIVLLMVLLLMCSTLTACGGSEETNKQGGYSTAETMGAEEQPLYIDENGIPERG